MTFEWQKDKLYSDLVDRVIDTEGEYVDDPDDKGGPTKFGIATNYNRLALQKLGVKSVRDLTEDQAKQIYYWKYWLAGGCNRIPDKMLAYLHFDSVVNHGIAGAARLLFKLSKNPAHFEAGGKNKELWLRLFIEYQAYRADYFTRLDTWWKHGQGWIRNRITALALEALSF